MLAVEYPMGIRPMFYGYTEKGKVAFSSVAKALVPLCHDIKPFPPGCYYDGEKIVRYNDLGDVKHYVEDDVDLIGVNLREKLVEAVDKRLQSDAPIGFCFPAAWIRHLFVQLRKESWTSRSKRLQSGWTEIRSI